MALRVPVRARPSRLPVIIRPRPLANQPGGFTAHDLRLADAFGGLAAGALQDGRALADRCAMVVHDLQAPLTAILLGIDLLVRRTLAAWVDPRRPPVSDEA